MRSGTVEESQTTRIEANGRIVIPARFREALGLRPGDEVMLVLDGDRLVVRSRRAAVRRVREAIARINQAGRLRAPGTGSVVDEFLRERREEGRARDLRLDALLSDPNPDAR
jgi:AbrB family looped-hinge helix DNA binding protein